MSKAWPLDIPPPKVWGAPQRTSLKAFREDPRVTFLRENVRFCVKMIFPGNLSVPVIIPGPFERIHTFLIE